MTKRYYVYHSKDDLTAFLRAPWIVVIEDGIRRRLNHLGVGYGLNMQQAQRAAERSLREGEYEKRRIRR